MRRAVLSLTVVICSLSAGSGFLPLRHIRLSRLSGLAWGSYFEPPLYGAYRDNFELECLVSIFLFEAYLFRPIE